MITTKRQMYALLAGGALGNTIQQYFSLSDWEPHAALAPLWGVRSLSRMDKRLRLDVPTGDVATVVRREFPDGCNLSPMVDHDTVFRGEVWENGIGPHGVQVFGTFEDARLVKWREAMRRGRTWRGVSASLLLRHLLTPSSYEDLAALLDRYPGHVVELTACCRCVGLIPGRNGVVWEVRAY